MFSPKEHTMSIATAGIGHFQANGRAGCTPPAASSNAPGRASPAAWLMGCKAPFRSSSGSAPEDDPQRDARFVAAYESYLDLGGMARENVVATQLVFSCALGPTRLARWIAEHKVLSVCWNGDRWLPIFQFETRGAVPSRTLVTIVQEMASSGDDMAVVEWFCRPNLWLDGRAPAAVLHHDGMAVLHAARADCFPF
jgi:hypothetical protein